MITQISSRIYAQMYLPYYYRPISQNTQRVDQYK